MNSMYESRLSEIKAICKKIISTEGKITFLLDRRRAFSPPKYTAPEAEIITQWCTDEIEKINILKQFENKSKTLEPKVLQQQKESHRTECKQETIHQKVEMHLGFLQDKCPRKHKIILNQTEFKKLISWTTYFYENEYAVPEIIEPIRVVNTNKTFIQLAFRYLFKELHKSKTYPSSLFEFYQKAFKPYSDDKRENFFGAKNNDAVKKLMNIDY